MRLDLFLVKNQYCESRNKASALISDGNVIVNGNRVVKASYQVDDIDVVELINDQKQYVARSAAKLLTAKQKFDLDFTDKIAVDLGASTGGFCEVMLENGISRIYAVDIGTNQLHPKIKSDKRVINKEHTNARFITSADFDDQIDIITCDLSFISLKLIINAAFCSLKQGGEFICLVKPQFEVGNANVGKNGVVKDLKLHIKVVKEIVEYATTVGFSVCDVSFSGLEGESGNREYLLYMKKTDNGTKLDIDKISRIVLGDVK